MPVATRHRVDHYYDYHPTVVLERPVALAGFFGVELGSIAGALSQRTGLPAIELERWIEHEAGRSVSELVLVDGERALREREVPLLKRALADQPPAIIALSDATLTEYDARKLVLDRSRLIYLRAELEDLLGRIQQHLESSPGCYWPFVLRGPEHVEDLQALFDERRAGYESAELIVEVTGKHPNTVAEELLGLLSPS